MKRYIAVLEIEDDEEIIDASVTYSYSYNGMIYKATERMKLKEENKDVRNKTYEDGLNEAWELVREIIYKPDKRRKVFGVDVVSAIIKNYSALQAIEKIKEYEKTQEKSVYKIGDRVEIIEEHDIVGLPAANVGTIGEVMEIDCVSEYLVKTYGKNSMFYYYSGNALKSANEVIIVGDEVVDKNEWGIKGVVTEITERCIAIVEDEGNVSKWRKNEFERTGRHFTEIEKVLKQMKENKE